MNSYEHITKWHVLFDELCLKESGADTASLAARYCQLANGGGQKQFDAVLRNLNNWRSGRHIPRLKSLRILETMLDVGRDPELLDHWNALYKRAHKDFGDESKSTMENIETPLSRSRRANAGLAAGGGALFFAGAALGAAVVWSGVFERPFAADAPMIDWEPVITMKVGESKVIHGERGDCGKAPREWDDVFNSLPVSEIGAFSDGGIVRRNSKYCKGPTPSRGIRFTATKPGIEEMRITGDFMKITVSPTNAVTE